MSGFVTAWGNVYELRKIIALSKFENLDISTGNKVREVVIYSL